MGGRWSEEELERFERAALRLPRIELEVLLLSVQDRLRNDEIAARLRISKRRVERHLARALYRFTRFLEEEEQERPWWKFW